MTAEDRSVWASTDEYNLIAHLFEQQEYNRFFRPVRNKSEVIYVSFEMALIQIITLVRLALAHKVSSDNNKLYTPAAATICPAQACKR